MGGCKKTMQLRLRRPNVAHFERSQGKIACGLTADHTDPSLAEMAPVY